MRKRFCVLRSRGCKKFYFFRSRQINRAINPKKSATNPPSKYQVPAVLTFSTGVVVLSPGATAVVDAGGTTVGVSDA